MGRTLLMAVALFGVCMVVFGFSRSFLVSLVALAVSGGADMVNVVIRQTLVQLETPDAMRGRVSAVNSIFIGASNQLGEFESGATAALLGPVGSVVAGGVGTVLVALAWFRLFPVARAARPDRAPKRSETTEKSAYGTSSVTSPSGSATQGRIQPSAFSSALTPGHSMR